MSLNRTSTRQVVYSAVRQRGFAIVSAIFLLLLLAALGAFMVTMSSAQHAASAQDVEGSRSYQAARAGIEWSVYQIMNPENTNPAVAPYTTQYTCPAGVSTLNTLSGALTGFGVSITCARVDYIEGGNQISVYQLTSIGTSGAAGTAHYVERRLSATVNTCRKTLNGENCG